MSKLAAGSESSGSAEAGADSHTVTEQGQSRVVLSEKKLAAAGIQVERAKLGTLLQTHSVPGRVVYNGNRHIEVTTPTAGIVTEVLVKPGDTVQARQILAWLNSPEVGTARADVLQRKTEAVYSQSLADRAARLKVNVTTLNHGLRQESDFNALRKQLTGRVLGAYREKLFGAYSRLRQAEKMVKNAAPLGEKGVLSGKVMLAYQTEFLDARAALEAVCEQAELEVWKQNQEASAAAHDAQRRLEIAKQHLSSLLLSASAVGNSADLPDVEDLGASEDDLEHLSRVAVRAPFQGTIESRPFSASERVQANSTLFVLADTTSMWVAAEIREGDWTALSIKTGQSLSVTIPALNGTTLPASVEFVGREVSLNTNAISIMARLDNSDGRLRPGLFVRVSVPTSEKKNALVIPTSAVQQHAEQAFVFVSETPQSFCRVDVVLGQEGAKQTEILSGLKLDDPVVTRGAFLLKSELLLESEGE